MIAKVIIYDDNNNPKGVYELIPSRTYENDISTKYIFEFEYNQLNYDKYNAENKSHKVRNNAVTRSVQTYLSLLNFFDFN